MSFVKKQNQNGSHLISDTILEATSIISNYLYYLNFYSCVYEKKSVLLKPVSNGQSGMNTHLFILYKVVFQPQTKPAQFVHLTDYSYLSKRDKHQARRSEKSRVFI